MILTCYYSTISAQNNTAGRQNVMNKQYCVVKKDGVNYIQSNGNNLSTDVTLQNGTIIKTDGTLTPLKGESYTVKSGECVDSTGKVVSSTHNQNLHRNDIPVKQSNDNKSTKTNDQTTIKRSNKNTPG